MNYAAFPLDLVVLPDELVALHLFEERYLQLYENHKDGKAFAIVYENEKSRSNFASMVKIDKTANHFPDGTVDVIVKGLGAINILHFNEKDTLLLYPTIVGDQAQQKGLVAEDLKSIFGNYLKLINKKQPTDPNFNLFYIANRLELDAQHKKGLMSLLKDREMNYFLINQIRLMSRCLELEVKLKQKFHLN